MLGAAGRRTGSPPHVERMRRRHALLGRSIHSSISSLPPHMQVLDLDVLFQTLNGIPVEGVVPPDVGPAPFGVDTNGDAQFDLDLQPAP